MTPNTCDANDHPPLPDRLPITIADCICTVDRHTHVVMDRVEAVLPDGTTLQIMEASDDRVGGTFYGGAVCWEWDHGTVTFSDWLCDIGATIRNEDTGTVIDHGNEQ